MLAKAQDFAQVVYITEFALADRFKVIARLSIILGLQLPACSAPA